MAGTSRALAIVKPGAAQSSDGPGIIDTSSSSSQFKKPVVAGNAHAHAHAPDSTSNKLCKNIAIYGSCKYEGRGCAFSHDVEGKRGTSTPISSRPSTPSSNLTANSSAFTPSAPAFTPSTSSSTPTPSKATSNLSITSNNNSTSANTSIASLAASANVFIPKGATSAVSTPKAEEHPQFPSFTPASTLTSTTDSPTSALTQTLSQQQPSTDEVNNMDEDDEDFDGLNPYAAVQSPPSTSGGNLPALSSSYHSAHSGHSAPASSTTQSQYDPNTPSFEPSYGIQEQPTGLHNQQQQQQQQQEYGYDSYAGEGQVMHSQQMENSNPYLTGGMPGMELYSQAMHQPLQYHLYHPALPHLTPPHLNAHQHIMQTFFMSPTIREELQRKQEACYPPSVMAANHRDILLNDRYWGLIPLDKAPPNANSSQHHANNSNISMRLYGWRSWMFRVMNDRDGKLYAIRRMEGYRLTNPESILLIEKWSHLTHPGIVTVREAFTTRAFGDHSLCFVYDYHPLSSTLLEIHLTTPARGQAPHPPIPERVLWSYLVQLASAVRMVHKNNMAVRCLDPSKVIITGKNRVRINGIGILDVLAYDGGKSTASFQQEDLLSLGKLFLSLACRSLSAIHNIQQSLDMGVARTYSSDFSNALLYLLSKPNPARKSIDEFWSIIAGHVDDELRGSFDHSDLLEGELARELENGRLFRLMAKFGFINERPEYDHDPRWAETGDRYIIKLFRDYVFHQIDEHGRPVIDLSHVLTCLNKLDAGVDEQIVLVSRDEQSCLIVSYREIRTCLENSFRELAR